MKKFFKGVVWPHGPIKEDGKTNYRYVVIGMIATDEQIADFKGKNEIIVEGPANGLIEVEALSQRDSKIRVGDASNVLTNLNLI